MLIKRNVYFSAIDEDGEERLYSTTEVMDEQDYIERLYAEADAEETLDNLKAAGIGGAAAVGLGATAYGVHKGAGAYAKRAAEKRAAANEPLILEEMSKAGGTRVKKAVEKERAKIADAARAYQGRFANYESLQKEADAATAARKAAQRAKVMKDIEKGKIKIKDAKFLEKAAGKVSGATSKAVELAKKNKWATAGIGLGTLAVGAGGGYGVHKLRHRNDE